MDGWVLVSPAQLPHSQGLGEGGAIGIAQLRPTSLLHTLHSLVLGHGAAAVPHGPKEVGAWVFVPPSRLRHAEPSAPPPPRPRSPHVPPPRPTPPTPPRPILLRLQQSSRPRPLRPPPLRPRPSSRPSADCGWLIPTSASSHCSPSCGSSSRTWEQAPRSSARR